MSQAEPTGDMEAPSRQIPDTASMDRTISPIAGRLGGGMAGRFVTVAALIAGCGVFLLASWRHVPAKPKAPLEPARQVVAFEPATTAPSPLPAPTLANPGPGAPVLDGAQVGASGQVPALQAGSGGGSAQAISQAQSQASSRAAQVQAIRSAPILAFSQSSPSPGAPLTERRVLAAQDAAVSKSELDQLRQGSTIALARATRLPDRNFLITAGTSIPCTLQTAMDTATPGYVSCLIGSDVYSDNGAVVLMEKGAKVLGEYRSGMRQGSKRLFVLWTRALTPTGVAIALASPASDEMGRAGFDGTIDTHFWERFGGALLLSVVDGASQPTSRNGSNGAITRAPSEAAAIALENSINIPPSLTKAQGSDVAIFVAQDLDFSAVYALKAR